MFLLLPAKNNAMELLTVLLLSLAAFAAEAAAKPNILVVLTDDQGRGDYSAFGTKDIRTPHMARLCREPIPADTRR